MKQIRLVIGGLLLCALFIDTKSFGMERPQEADLFSQVQFGWLRIPKTNDKVRIKREVSGHFEYVNALGNTLPDGLFYWYSDRKKSPKIYRPINYPKESKKSPYTYIIKKGKYKGIYYRGLTLSLDDLDKHPKEIEELLKASKGMWGSELSALFKPEGSLVSGADETKLAAQEENKAKREHVVDKRTLNFLNAVILLDEAGALMTTRLVEIKDAVMMTLLHAVHQKVVVIASSTLILAISDMVLSSPGRKLFNGPDSPLVIDLWKELKDNTKWRAYNSKDESTTFTVLIPQLPGLKNIDLKKQLSLNVDFLEPNSMVENIDFYFNLRMSLKRVEKPKIDVEILKKIILPNKEVRKRLVLVGHGVYDPAKLSPQSQLEIKPTIAALSYTQYNNLLQHLNTAGCDFLFVTTCFGGGLNLLEMHKKGVQSHLNDVPNIQDFNFILTVASLDDRPSSMANKIEYSKFFEGLNNFFGTRGYVKDSEHHISPVASHVSRASFENIFFPFMGVQLENTPSVKFPGIRSFFRPVVLAESFEVITYPKLLEKELAAFKIAPGESLKKPRSTFKSPVYVLDNTKQVILLYPSVMSMPLSIQKNIFGNIPLFVSMIPGRGRHYIEEIRAHDFEIKYLLNVLMGLFFDHRVFEQSGSVAPKAYFIKQLTLKSRVLDNVLITLDNYDIYTKDQDINVYFQDQQKNVHISGKKNEFFTDFTQLKTVFGQVYTKDIIISILNTFKPFPGALYHATGGIEADKLIEKKIEASFEPKLIKYSDDKSRLQLLNSIITKRLTVKKNKLGVAPFIFMAKKAPVRCYLEKVIAHDYENAREFLTDAFLKEDKTMVSAIPTAYFIKELQLKNETLHNVSILFRGRTADNETLMLLLYQSDAGQNVYTAYSGPKRSGFVVRDFKKIGKSSLTIKPQVILDTLNRYKSNDFTAEVEIEKKLRKALGLPDLKVNEQLPLSLFVPSGIEGKG